MPDDIVDAGANADASADAPEVSQSAAKNAKKAAEKQSKKRPDPAGLAEIARGMEAMNVKDFATAKACFERAEELCANSSVKGEAKVKAPKEKKETTTAKAPEAKQDALDATHLPAPGSAGHVTAKMKEHLPPGAKNYAINSVAAMAEHLSATGGRWRTRFPPEPNGYLHIGHAKAMYFDFGVARKHGGETYLRFDDTNPAAEKQEYIDSIIDSVMWLGHKPVKTTYSSDYFDDLYEMAIALIKHEKAYVCFQSKEEVFQSRKVIQSFQKMCAEGNLPRYETPLPDGAESPYRNTSVEENLRLFEKMKNREFKEGECCLRMKGDLRSDIPSMWDLAAYRIKYETHPHSGDKWCIYPTYDYTHCLVDSLENITHSLCTLEFETRQAPNGSYYWLLDALDVYKPVTWEFARCNITYNVMSKRKLNTLVTKGIVNGWDDPRLLTLEGLRRRGYTPTAINAFCAGLGVTRNDNTQPLSRLEGSIRDELKDTASRYFAVLEPLKVNITNHPGGDLVCEAPVHPTFPERGMRNIHLTPTIFIEKSDFKTADVDGYYGLAPGKTVRLQFGYNITCTGMKQNDDGSIAEIDVTIDMESRSAKPPKGILHWATPAFVKGEVRLYDRLFTVEVPGKAEDAPVSDETAASTDASTAVVDDDNEEDGEETDKVDWLSQINPDSLVIHESALLEPGLMEFASKPLATNVQLQRLGFFTFDKDSTAAKAVLNRTVTLKESSAKAALASK
jgi:glutaminyl-tRNA synthetase